MKKGYKICPFCANEIINGAIKCQYCKEFLNKKESKKSSSKWRKTVDKYLFNEQNVDYKLDIHHKDLLESCINIGKKRKTWCRISIICLALIILAGFFGWFNSRSLESKNKAYGSVKLISLAFIFRCIYFFVWLIKNYRIFLKSKYYASNLKLYLLLIFYRICPIINLFKPKGILENFMKNFFMNAKKDYNKNLIKIRWIFWDILLVSSFFMCLFSPVIFPIILILLFVSYFGHSILLLNIINKIIWAQEYKKALLWTNELLNNDK